MTGSATKGIYAPPTPIEIARMLHEGPASDICDVSAGQTSLLGKPVYGRMFQTPFSDRIRNETGMKTKWPSATSTSPTMSISIP